MSGENVTQEDFDSKIVILMKENAKITTEEIAKKLGISPRTIKRHIKEMTNIKYIGSGYSG